MDGADRRRFHVQTARACVLAVVLSLAGCTGSAGDQRDHSQKSSSDSAAGTSPGARPDTVRPDGERGGRDSDVAGTSKSVGDEGPWDVDLEADEQRGGHTIARHVGRTDAQLKARLQRESIGAASTYEDLEHAERVVELALAENQRRVQRWINQRSPKTNLAIRYRARDGLPTGRMLRRGEKASEQVEGAVVVLRWRDDNWYVLTTYPEKPR